MSAERKWVYHFTEGSANMRDLLGGKGAGAAEMTRAGMPVQRVEQAAIPIHVMPHGDTAGARGAAIEALNFARR